jgi:MoxR-like ATPase
MSKIDASLKANFEAKLFEMFPDVKESGNVTRKQLLAVRDAQGVDFYPVWLMTQPISRGLYAINGTTPSTVAPKAKTKPESVMVDYTNSSSLVPSVDKNYVPFGNYRDVESIIKSKIFYPAYISGPTGNGKSTMVEQTCAKQKRPLIRINFNSMTDEDQLIGTKTLIDGNVEIVEGPVVIAMRMGMPILFDEIDAGNSNTLMCLQPILEGKPFYFKLKNELIYPAEGFNIFATANTKGKGSDDGRYIGTNVLNEAFLERFAVTFNQDYPAPSVELKIVTKLMEQYECVDAKFADTLIKWADAIRRTFDAGGVDETITTRRLTHIIRAFAIFKNQKKSVELCTNRFDDATRLAFVDLFDKVSSEDDVTPVAPTVAAETDHIPF